MKYLLACLLSIVPAAALATESEGEPLRGRAGDPSEREPASSDATPAPAPARTSEIHIELGFAAVQMDLRPSDHGPVGSSVQLRLSSQSLVTRHRIGLEVASIRGPALPVWSVAARYAYDLELVPGRLSVYPIGTLGFALAHQGPPDRLATFAEPETDIALLVGGGAGARLLLGSAFLFGNLELRHALLDEWSRSSDSVVWDHYALEARYDRIEVGPLFFELGAGVAF